MKTFLKPLLLALIIVALIGYFAWREYTPSGYVFRPYESTTLREWNIPTNAAQKAKLESELAEFQSSLAAFTKPEDLDKKLNTLSLISEYQQMLGEYIEAKKTLETALSLQVNPKLLQSYAQLLFTMGAKEPAVSYIDDALKFAPETIELWRTKIDMLSEIHKKDLAFVDSTYQKAIDSTENSIDLVTMYATYLGRQGRKEEAIQYWTKAQQIFPKQAGAYQGEIDALKE